MYSKAVAMAMSDIDQDLAKDLAYWVGPCYKHGVESLPRPERD